MIDISTMTIGNTDELSDEVATIDYPQDTNKIDAFSSLYCKECKTHLNGGTICPNCGASK